MLVGHVSDEMYVALPDVLLEFTKGPESVYFSQPGIHRDPHSQSVDTIYFDDILCATTLDEIQIRKPEPAKSK